MLDPVLVLEVVAGAGQVGVERLRERGAVVGVDAAEPLAAGVAELGLGVAEHLLPARGEEQAVLAHVPVPQAVVGALQRERVALLGLGEARERVLVGDRVAERVLEQRPRSVTYSATPASAAATSVSRSALVVEQQDRARAACGRGSRCASSSPPVSAVDQERVVRVLVERGERGVGAS